jgi:hypothetical protein
MVAQDAARELLNLTERDGLESSRSFQSKRDPADPAEEVEDADHRLPPFLNSGFFPSRRAQGNAHSATVISYPILLLILSSREASRWPGQRRPRRMSFRYWAEIPESLANAALSPHSQSLLVVLFLTTILLHFPFLYRMLVVADAVLVKETRDDGRVALILGEIAQPPEDELFGGREMVRLSLGGGAALDDSW